MLYLEVVFSIGAEEERMRRRGRFSVFCFGEARGIGVGIGGDGFVGFDFFVGIGDDF